MKTKGKKRGTKTVLEFDEKARKEYLTGFQKRKRDRKKHYTEKLLKRLKEEQNELKKQRKSFGKQAALPQKQLPPLSEEMAALPSVLDLPSHTVTTTDITAISFSSQLYLGQNTPSSSKPAVEESLPEATSVSRRKYNRKLEEVKQLEMKVAGLTGKKKKSKKNKGKAGGKKKRKNKH